MCNEVQTVGALTAYGRGFNIIVGPAEMKPLVDSNCTYCGQCVSVCPTAALTGHGYIQETWNAIFDPTKTVVVQVAPAIRAAIGEEFGIAPGTPVTGKLAAGLRRLGFDAVFDTTFGRGPDHHRRGEGDHRARDEGENLPILTSCCPGWINFIEYQFPNLKYMPSSCKSPQQMTARSRRPTTRRRSASSRRTWWWSRSCRASPRSTRRSGRSTETEGVRDVDYVITTRELAKMFKEGGIDLRYMDDEEFDNPLGESTGAGVIFGATGGVLEAALRTALRGSDRQAELDQRGLHRGARLEGRPRGGDRPGRPAGARGRRLGPGQCAQDSGEHRAGTRSTT
jgi:NADH-quinone oxidoreductase subunit G